MPRCVVIIPARYASSRFPGKPLVALAGRPMIQHVYERACQARLVDTVLVATDDARILAQRYGYPWGERDAALLRTAAYTKLGDAERARDARRQAEQLNRRMQLAT